jgi:hypothetical protein
MGASATARYGASGQLDSIQENTEANAAGNEGFLQQLPWQDKMRARLRSLALLGLICWVLVVS